MSAINRAKALLMTDEQTRCELRARSAGEADTVRDDYEVAYQFKDKVVCRPPFF